MLSEARKNNQMLPIARAWLDANASTHAGEDTKDTKDTNTGTIVAGDDVGFDDSDDNSWR